MLAKGALCAACKSGCCNAPSELLPIELTGLVCHVCHDDPKWRHLCAACQGTGKALIRGCPRREVPEEVWDGIRFANLAEAGTWPIAGGTLDQTRAFIEFSALVWIEQNEIASNGRKES